MASGGTSYLVPLFVISNLFFLFGSCAFLFVVGMRNVGTAETAAGAIGCIVCMVVAELAIGVLSLVGCLGAIAQNKKDLRSYVSLMIILSILEIVYLVKLNLDEQHNKVVLLKTICVIMIITIVFTVVSILLAITISCRIVSGEIGDKIRQQRFTATELGRCVGAQMNVYV